MSEWNEKLDEFSRSLGRDRVLSPIYQESYGPTRLHNLGERNGLFIGVAMTTVIWLGTLFPSCRSPTPSRAYLPLEEIAITRPITNDTSFDNVINNSARPQLTRGLVEAGQTAYAQCLRDQGHVGVIPLSPRRTGISPQSLKDPALNIKIAVRQIQELQKNEDFSLSKAICHFWYGNGVAGEEAENVVVDRHILLRPHDTGGVDYLRHVREEVGNYETFQYLKERFNYDQASPEEKEELIFRCNMYFKFDPKELDAAKYYMQKEVIQFEEALRAEEKRRLDKSTSFFGSTTIMDTIRREREARRLALIEDNEAWQRYLPPGLREQVEISLRYINEDK